MKQCSPILLFLTVLFSCFSCNKQNQSNSENPDYPKTFIQDSLLYSSLYLKASENLEKDSLNLILNELKKVAFKSNNPKYIAGYHLQKGATSTSLDSSYLYFQKAKDQFTKLKDSVRTPYVLLKLSEIAMENYDYDLVQSLATEALPYLKDKPNPEYVSHLNNMIGLSFNHKRDYKNALTYYEKALKASDNELFKSIIKNNIAKIFQEKKEYKKAITIYSEIFSNEILGDHIESKARTLDNLGYTHYLNGSSEGLKYMLQSLKIKHSINDEYGLIFSYINLSNYYLKKDPAISSQYARKAYDLSRTENDNDSKLQAIELLSKSSKNKDESDRYFSEYVQLNDSIDLVKSNKSNQFAKLRYDFKSAEEEALKSKAESVQNKLIAERAQNRNRLAIFIIIFMLAISFLFYKLTKSKHAKDKIKENYNAEIRISKKVHDELANDVYNVMNFANNKNLENPDKKETLLVALDSIYNRTRDISRENSPIDLGENYPLQLKGMLFDYQTENLNVIVSEIDTINWNSIDDTKKTVVYRVLQELMINMKKHSQASLTVVKFKSEGKTVTIQYSDNGIGFENEKTYFKNGLQNVENRIHSIKGSIIFDKNASKGIKTSITFLA